MTFLIRRFLIAALLASGPGIALSACLSYEPTEVTLVGVVTFKTFAGPPNYESVASGDRAERVAVLELKEPICVRGKSPDLINEPRDGIMTVQLVIISRSPVTLVEGHKIAVTGTLFGSHTGHHRTPVLLQVRAVKDAI
jgi:Domain of unknown function (DUF4431)